MRLNDTLVKRFATILIAIAATLFAGSVWAQRFTISGVVLDRATKRPVDMAVVNMPQSELWAVADKDGEFTVRNVPQGDTKVTVSCLGYVTREFELNINRDITGLKLLLDEDNLSIEGVVVTAQENRNSMATSRIIDRNTMDHMQMVNVSDLASLLPGGVTINPDLMNSSGSKFSVRSYGETAAQSGFGTAVEVDGVRMSNNGDFSGMSGVDTRNIASANVESVEVITGVPSVEYGDVSTGVVKIHTKKGRTPYTVSTTINPRTKQFALSKGFDLGRDRGAVNFSIERARSVSNIASPYTSYDRNTATINYSNTFNQGENRQPLRLSVGITGNLGGMDSKADPDAFLDTYEKTRDNNIRGNFTLNWLLNKSWITSLEINGSANYTDRLKEVRTNKSSSVSMAARHGTEEGYFMAVDYDSNPDAPVTLIPAGYWYETAFTDSKPLNASGSVKANWFRRWGGVASKLKLGVNYTLNGNEGRGLYYDNRKYAEVSWRPYEYSSEPYMHNVAVYLEENLTLPVSTATLDLSAGVRSDNTIISGSAYGTVSNISPRFNAKLTLFEGRGRRHETVRELSVRAGWGQMVKLPSFYTLYPSPSYQDQQVFSSTTTADGTAYIAYYMLPKRQLYNPDLRWQVTDQTEVGVDMNLCGVQISLSAYYNKTRNPYIINRSYTPYTYKYTNISSLNSCPIPTADRRYAIDRTTGVVTITDVSGRYEPYVADYNERKSYTASTYADNGSAYSRSGVEWVVNFGQIRAIRTEIRLDGAFSYYKWLEQTMMPYLQMGNDADGSPFKYLGWYVGDNSVGNGSIQKQVRTNLTLTTHIPKIRTIISLRLESSLYRSTQNLSEWSDGGQWQRSYAVPSRDVNGDPQFGADLYGEKHYVVSYPAYYSKWDAPDEKLPFMPALLAAKESDRALYNELSKMLYITSTNYAFYPQRTSAYFAVNLSVTKEIGKIASISFYANNCFNNMGRVRNSASGAYSQLYQSAYIQDFYYGVSLRLKF